MASRELLGDFKLSFREKLHEDLEFGFRVGFQRLKAWFLGGFSESLAFGFHDKLTLAECLVFVVP